jgi:hypothetical protein
MSVAALNIISKSMESLGINYEFGAWNSKIVYPYFVGEYQETPTLNEDGMTETTFILNGFSRGSWLELEQAKEKLEKYFNTLTVIAEKSAVAVFYDNSFVVPTGDAELKRIQINLKIKEWKVN